MNRPPGRILTCGLVLAALAFAVWSTALVVRVVEGRHEVRKLSMIIEAVGDLHDRALFQLVRPGNDVLGDWDVAKHRTALEIAQRDFQSSRVTLDQVLREVGEPPATLEQFDRASQQLIAHAENIFSLAARRNAAVAAGQQVSELRALEFEASNQMAQRMDGSAATRAIRAAEPEGYRVPVIALTAHAMSGDREQCLAAGMDDYLTKPLRKEAVLGTLAKWLRRGAPPAAQPPATHPAAAEAPVDRSALVEVAGDDAEFLASLVETYTSDADALLP
jgi:CheY-like chemotaxis protein